MTNLNKYLFLLLLVLSYSNVFSQDFKKLYANKKLSEVTYAMSHPLHDWEGINKNVRAVIIKNNTSNKIKKVAVSLNITDFDSENANRDSHAVKVLEALKYPAVTFISTEIIYKEDELIVSGILNFHNIKKSIKFPVIPQQEDGKEFFSGSFEVDMTQYGIKRPSLMNIPTDKYIKISFSLFF